MINTLGMIELRIEPLLEARGESFYWLANKAGISHSVMSKLRNNKMKAITVDALDRICGVLDCEPGDILVRTHDKKKGSKK